MFDFEEGSIEEVKIRLQNLGLILNDIKNANATVTNEAYETLLEYSISMLEDFEEYTKKVQKLLVN